MSSRNPVGVFGNITDPGIERTIGACAQLCEAGFDSGPGLRRFEFVGYGVLRGLPGAATS
ncbi:hypothetical protein ACIPSH_30475 [Streptomyces iakyrus]|uniref:hypothetical protein n=1 Tax=Streptomyces iakyrus TaxID=68219 RepID=UPI00382B43C0